MRIAKADVKTATDIARFATMGKYEAQELRIERDRVEALKDEFTSERSVTLALMRISVIESRLVDIDPSNPLR